MNFLEILIFLLLLNFINLIESQCENGLIQQINGGCSSGIHNQVRTLSCTGIDGRKGQFVTTTLTTCPRINATLPAFNPIDQSQTPIYEILNNTIYFSICYSKEYNVNLYNVGTNCINSNDLLVRVESYKLNGYLFIDNCSNNQTYFIPTNVLTTNTICPNIGNGLYSTFYINLDYGFIECPNCNGHGICSNETNYNCICDQAYSIPGNLYCDTNYCDQLINPCNINNNQLCDRINANCYCKDGYINIGNSSSNINCVDINECEIGNNGSSTYPCPLNFICNNLNGSFECICPFYQINDTTCQINDPNSKCTGEPICGGINKGVCINNNNNQTCKCNSLYTGNECQYEISNNSTIDFNSTQPTTTLFENSIFKSLIIIKSIREIDFTNSNNNIIKEYNFQNLKWLFNNQTSSNEIETYIYNTTIPTKSINNTERNTSISILYKWFKNIDGDDDDSIEFANQLIKIEPFSLKFYINILNGFAFENNLNTLQLVLSVKSNDFNNNNDDDYQCKSSLDINTTNKNLDYFKIQIDNRLLLCNFIKRGIVDNVITSISSSYKVNNNTDLDILINLPNFKETIKIDPSFQILIDTDYSNSNQICKNNDKLLNWKIIVGVVVSVVGLAIIIILGFIIYKRNKVNIKIGIAKLKDLKN